MRKLRSIICSALMAIAASMAVTATAAPLQHEERVPVVERQPVVDVDGDWIELRNPGPEPVKVEIFSITGQLVKSVVVKGTPVKLQLPKGFYIVKCDNWTKRVMLK